MREWSSAVGFEPGAAGRAVARQARLSALCLAALAAVLLALSAAAQGLAATSQTLDVNFFVNGTISVTLADGTAVGTTSGAPSVIPAGYYAIVVLGPGGCTQLPLFDLKDPGENLQDDMGGGEVTSETYNAYLAPNSTYTWRTDNLNPEVVHTFATSSVVGGTPLQSSPSGAPTSSTPTPTSQDVVGSEVAPYRGKLTGAVSSRGVLTLLYKGKKVTGLAAGRYTLTITDRSTTGGFMLEKASHSRRSVTGAGFVGTRSASIELTAGRWVALSRLGTKTYPIVVSAA